MTSLKKLFGVLKKVKETPSTNAKKDILRGEIFSDELLSDTYLTLLEDFNTGTNIYDRFISRKMLQNITLSPGVGEFPTTEEYLDFLKKISTLTGKGSTKERTQLISSFLSRFGQYMDLAKEFIARTPNLGINELGAVKAIAKEGDEKLLVEKYNMIKDIREIYNYYRAGEIEKLEPKLLTIMGVMLPENVSRQEIIEILQKGPLYLETKYDGIRVQSHCNSKGEVKMFTRNNNDISKNYPSIVKALKEFAMRHGDIVLDGEIITGGGTLKSFKDITRTIHSKELLDIPIEYKIFDILYLQENLTSLSQEKRKQILNELELPENLSLSEYKLCHSIECIENELNEKDGYEGVILKEQDAPYCFKRTKSIMKYKFEIDTIDLLIMGALKGLGVNKNRYSSVIVGYQQDDKIIELCRVSGLKEQELEFLNETIDIDGHEIQNENYIFKTNPEVILKTPLVAEIGGSNYSFKNGLPSVRFPKFLNFRRDKSLDEIETIESLNKKINK